MTKQKRDNLQIIGGLKKWAQEIRMMPKPCWGAGPKRKLVLCPWVLDVSAHIPLGTQLFAFAYMPLLHGKPDLAASNPTKCGPSTRNLFPPVVPYWWVELRSHLWAKAAKENGEIISLISMLGRWDPWGRMWITQRSQGDQKVLDSQKTQEISQYLSEGWNSLSICSGS